MNAPMLRPLRAAAIVCLLGAVLVSAGCSRSHVAMPDAPASARPLPATGPHEVRTDLMVADMYARYGGEFRGFSVQSYLLDGADWASVEAHYGAALQGWRADPRFGPRSGRIQARTWADGDRVLVVEMFDADGTPVLLVGSNVGDAGER